MKTLLTIFVTAAAVVLLLGSGLTPWRIVRTDAPVSTNTRTLPLRRATVPPNPTPDHSGDWMRDPHYRTSLEKTTLVGRPEPAASRDGHRP